MSNNPYTNAADMYSQSAKATVTNQRELEANILLKAARKLADLRDNYSKDRKKELDDALLYNRKLWTIFAAEATEDAHELPLQIKNNIANIAVFVFKRSIEIQAAPEPEKIDVLIDINRNIAAGLLESPRAEEQGSALPQEASTTTGADSNIETQNEHAMAEDSAFTSQDV